MSMETSSIMCGVSVFLLIISFIALVISVLGSASKSCRLTWSVLIVFSGLSFICFTASNVLAMREIVVMELDLRKEASPLVYSVDPTIRRRIQDSINKRFAEFDMDLVKVVEDSARSKKDSAPSGTSSKNLSDDLLVLEQSVDLRKELEAKRATFARAVEGLGYKTNP